MGGRVANQDLGRITGTTRAVAVVGYPVSHSLSPLIHNAAFAAAGLDYCYIALNVKAEEIEVAFKGLKAAGFAGFNLTAPHKESVIPLLDDLTEEARAIGAVNTVANRDGRWIGTNTDATGFRRLLEINGLHRQGMKAVVLGAGGAARAALYVLGRLSREVVVFNRTLPRAQALIESLAASRGSGRWAAFLLEGGELATHLRDADLLVNTTNVGMHPNDRDCPLPEGVTIPPGCGVVDMVYAPPRTRLLEVAERAGARAVSGHDMLLHQAVDAFTFWTGVEPDISVMDRALRDGRRRQMEQG
jgi:shikimate dehydrogenase